MFSFSSPAVLEQQLLTALEIKRQQIMSYLSTFPQGGLPFIIEQWISGLDGFLPQLQTFQSQADWLSLQGFPQAGQRLNFLLTDFAAARQQYIQTHMNGMYSQIAGARAWADANSFATNNILEATRNSQISFERSMQGFFDVWENRCYDCHTSVNLIAGGYCLDCARRRRLIY